MFAKDVDSKLAANCNWSYYKGVVGIGDGWLNLEESAMPTGSDTLIIRPIAVGGKPG